MPNPLKIVINVAEFDAAFKDGDKCYFAVLGVNADALDLIEAALLVAFSDTPRFVMHIPDPNEENLRIRLLSLPRAEEARVLPFEQWCALALSCKTTIVEIYEDYNLINADPGFQLAEVFENCI